MQGDRWDRVQEIFLAVADLDGLERHVRLDACGDAELRQEVEDLLRNDTGSALILDCAIRSEAARLIADDPPVAGARLVSYLVAE